MLIHPEVQGKVQVELDKARGGTGRILSASEIDSIPYFQAVWKESLRLYHAAPIGWCRVRQTYRRELIRIQVYLM